MVNAQKCQLGQEQDLATCEGKCAAYMWVSEWGAGVARQSRLMSDWWQLCDWCNGGWECVCCSAVNDWSCSPWVMCSCSVVRGNQIHDSYATFNVDEIESYHKLAIYTTIYTENVTPYYREMYLNFYCWCILTFSQQDKWVGIICFGVFSIGSLNL